ncbi:MAG: hypothetical protein K6G88_07335 [Lachnospiraceae bacterium]|nr:hypothetical protein [Lachnospiraceae bacterium]
MKREYIRPEIEFETLLPDIRLMSDISREMYNFYRSQYEIECSAAGLDPNDESNWRAYVATLDTSIPYCYHTANLFS